jgi:folate-binding protein YgfZ
MGLQSTTMHEATTDVRSDPVNAALVAFRRHELESRRPRVDAAERPGAATGVAPEEVEDEYLPYGLTDERHEPLCHVLATLGPVELEYASLRRGCGIMPTPHRATLRVSGPDALAVVDGVVTNAVKDLVPGESGAARRAFLLDRKGRIRADLLVAATPDGLLVDTDVTQGDLAEYLDRYVFTEDVTIEAIDGAVRRVLLSGPGACAVAGIELEDGGCGRVTIAGAEVDVIRSDQIGAPGLHLVIPADAAVAVVEHLLAVDIGAPVRPVGWHAWNIARIEGGTPLFNIDFTTQSLPNETSCLESHVSFRKGCYPGQEVVARVHNLGKPKQSIVGLQIEGEGLPVAGAALLPVGADEDTAPLGMMTSSAVSPMLGSRPVGLGTVRSGSVEPGTKVVVWTEAGEFEVTITATRHWPQPAADGDGETAT